VGTGGAVEFDPEAAINSSVKLYSQAAMVGEEEAGAV
jgi:hypothetical protein